jgi:hypothetical protein
LTEKLLPEIPTLQAGYPHLAPSDALAGGANVFCEEDIQTATQSILKPEDLTHSRFQSTGPVAGSPLANQVKKRFILLPLL